MTQRPRHSEAVIARGRFAAGCNRWLAQDGPQPRRAAAVVTGGARAAAFARHCSINLISEEGTSGLVPGAATN
jgi:hypothetical protein